MTRTSERRSSRPAGAQRRRRQHGAVAVELALMLPLLVVLVIGTIDFGFLLAQKASLANGARQGARLGVVNVFDTPTCDKVIQETRDGAETVGMPASDITVTVTGPSGPCTSSPCATANATPGRLTVRATYPAAIDIPFLPRMPFTLEGEGTYRCEYK